MTGASGLPTLPLTELIEYATHAAPPIPIMVIRENRDPETDRPSQGALTSLPEAVDTVDMEQLDQLPVVIQRALFGENSEITQQQLRHDLQHAADMMRDNQKLITMGRLAASIAHEINNPLEAVTNLLYLLRHETELSDAGANYLSLAERELARVTQISKQTLNFYRDTVTPIRVKPADLLEETLMLYARKLAEKRVEVVRQYKADDMLTVFPGEMRQVFSNLITNAIEAVAPGGKLYLRLRHSRMWSDAGVAGLRILIADNGTGIDVEARRHLGQLFFTTKGQSGTGLGLWVTRSIVQRYGGNIQVYSSTRREAHGTVFSIFMPTNLRPQVVRSEGGDESNDEPGMAFGQRGRATGTRGAQSPSGGNSSSSLEPGARDCRWKSGRRAFG